MTFKNLVQLRTVGYDSKKNKHRPAVLINIDEIKIYVVVSGNNRDTRTTFVMDQLHLHVLYKLLTTSELLNCLNLSSFYMAYGP